MSESHRKSLSEFRSLLCLSWNDTDDPHESLSTERDDDDVDDFDANGMEPEDEAEWWPPEEEDDDWIPAEDEPWFEDDEEV